MYGIEYANKRRDLYYKRHQKEDLIDDNGHFTKSFYAKYLLW